MSHPHPVIIRDARPDERDAVTELTLRAYSEHAEVIDAVAFAGLDGAVRNALATDTAGERMVAEVDGKLVGSVMLYPPRVAAYGHYTGEAAVPELRLLAVAREARGLGVGRALVEECIRRARRTGARELGLHTSQSMRAAVALYEKMGFVRTPEDDFLPGGNERVIAYRYRLSE